MSRILAVLCVFVFVSSASAQTFYEPVRYQYGGARPFYYGGNDPEMFRFAQREQAGRVNGFAFATADTRTFREVTDVAPAVYNDAFPRGNAAILGYTANDAHNDASRNAARYFRKIDAFAYAAVDENGALHVPPQIPAGRSGTISIRPSGRMRSFVSPMMQKNPATPGAIFIFPKKLLDQPLKPQDLKVADVR